MSAINAVQPSGVPVLSVDEQILFLPPSGHRVHNRARKILFFFEVDCLHGILELGEASTLRLEAGDILILPHSCVQHYISPHRETKRIHALRLIIDPEVAPPLVPGDAEYLASPFLGENSVEEFVRTQFSKVAHLKNGMNSELLESLARLRRESEDTTASRDFGYRFRAGAVCLELLVLVARQVRSTRIQSTARDSEGGLRIEEVREYIRKHLDTPLRLESIAAHLSISPEHLARTWKKATGVTIFDYVRRARIERAKSLLISSDANISQIAVACGFSSLALFSRTFKQETGVSPMKYRERLKP